MKKPYHKNKAKALAREMNVEFTEKFYNDLNSLLGVIVEGNHSEEETPEVETETALMLTYKGKMYRIYKAEVNVADAELLFEGDFEPRASFEFNKLFSEKMKHIRKDKQQKEIKK